MFSDATWAWIGPVLHVWGSACLLMLLTYFLRGRVLLAGVIVLLTGFGKELVVDHWIRGHLASTDDMVFNTIGVVFGVLFVHWWRRKREKWDTEPLP